MILSRGVDFLDAVNIILDMKHLLLWLNIAAFAGMLVAVSMSLGDRFKPNQKWVRYYFAYLGSITVWVLLHTVEYFIDIYVSPGLHLPQYRAEAAIVLAISSAILLAYAVFVEKFVNDGIRRRKTVLIGIIVGVYLFCGIVFIVLRQPAAERSLLIFFFSILFLYSLYALVVRDRYYGDALKRPIFPFFVISACFYPAFILDYAFVHAPLSMASYFPDAIITLPLYCLCWSVIVILHSLSRTHRADSGKGLPASFIKAHMITRREAQIIEYIIDGCRTATIADYLAITERTAENHIYNIYKKCRVTGRISLINAISPYRSAE